MALVGDFTTLFEGPDASPWSDERFTQGTTTGTQGQTDRLANVLFQPTTNTTNLFMHTSLSYGISQTAVAQVSFNLDNGDLDNLGLSVLDDGAGNRYELRINPSTGCTVIKFIDGVESVVGILTSSVNGEVNGGTGLVAGDSLGLRAINTAGTLVFTLLYNDTPVGTEVSDVTAPHTSGNPGFIVKRGGGASYIKVEGFAADGVSSGMLSVGTDNIITDGDSLVPYEGVGLNPAATTAAFSDLGGRIENWPVTEATSTGGTATEIRGNLQYGVGTFSVDGIGREVEYEPALGYTAYPVNPDYANTTKDESILYGIAIVSGMQVKVPDFVSGSALTWEVINGYATGAILNIDPVPTDDVELTGVEIHDTTSWDSLPVTLTPEGGVNPDPVELEKWGTPHFILPGVRELR